MFYFSLRQKLFLVSSLILLLPWVGIRYLQAIEDYLQQTLLENLSHYTQSVAAGLSLQAELIPEFPPGAAVFALPLQKRPQLDGYDNDWQDYFAYRQQLSTKGKQTNAVSPPTLLAGTFEDSLYLHMMIPDQQIVYLAENNPVLNDTFGNQNFNQSSRQAVDSIQLILDSGTVQRHLLVQTEAPGSINARDIITNVWESRVKVIWRERDNGVGFQLEIKIPISYVAKGLNVIVNNVGGMSEQTYRLAEELTIPLLSSPQKLTQRFKELGSSSGRRIWLLDKEGRVLVKSGSLITEGELSPVNPLFAWLLAPQSIADPWQGKTRLERDDIQSAWQGKSDSRRLTASDGESLILSSAWPVNSNQRTVAVLLIEESTAAIQLMQRSALAELLNLSLFVFLLLSVALIGFAGRLGNRIRRLRDITDQSIDSHGRVIGDIPESKKGDELDDLAAHVSAMLIRLRQYHDYLEKLASRLSHELRTPIAVVRSSLEIMHLNELSPENVEILHRADNGIMRLQTILNRMSEASRLEQTLDDSIIESFDFIDFLENMTEGYRGIYPQQLFVLTAETGSVMASKDLLAQCIDKLMSNAVGFSEPEQPIIIDARKSNDHWELSITNCGVSLPKGMESELFQSMVSIRDDKGNSHEPHLGLGLHIVRLVSEFHGGSVTARNTENGVCITVKIPLGELNS